MAGKMRKSKAVRLERLERMRALAPRVSVLEVYGWRDGKKLLLERVDLLSGEREVLDEEQESTPQEIAEAYRRE